MPWSVTQGISECSVKPPILADVICEQPLTYDILLQLKFCRDLGAFLKAFRSAYNESHHALDEFSMKANNQTQPKTACFMQL